MSVSPNGQWLAFSSHDSAAHECVLNVMPVSGGAARELLRLKPPEDVWGIVWTPDGRHLLFVRRNLTEERSDLCRVAVEGGEPQSLGLALNIMSQMSIHPDGRRIAYSYGLPRSEVWVMENFLPVRKADAPAAGRMSELTSSPTDNRIGADMR